MSAAPNSASGGRRVARALVWPMRRALDPRFADIVRRVSQLSDGLRQDAAETRSRLEQVVGSVAINSEALVELAGHVAERLDRFDASVDEIAHRLAALEAEIDRAAVPDGAEDPAAQPGAAPITVRQREGTVEIAEVTRTAIEEPWALRFLGGLDAGSRVHVATTEPSALPIALATLGHTVETSTGPLVSHPRLTATRRVKSCAAAVAIGVLDEGDRSARLAELRETLAPDGVMLLSLRVGLAIDADQDLLDPAAVAELLDGWIVEERLDVARTGATSWETTSVIPAEGLALVRALPPTG